MAEGASAVQFPASQPFLSCSPRRTTNHNLPWLPTHGALSSALANPAVSISLVPLAGRLSRRHVAVPRSRILLVQIPGPVTEVLAFSAWPHFHPGFTQEARERSEMLIPVLPITWVPCAVSFLGSLCVELIVLSRREHGRHYSLSLSARTGHSPIRHPRPGCWHPVKIVRSCPELG